MWEWRVSSDEGLGCSDGVGYAELSSYVGIVFEFTLGSSMKVDLVIMWSGFVSRLFSSFKISKSPPEVRSVGLATHFSPIVSFYS
jgi:hypothetical protein